MEATCSSVGLEFSSTVVGAASTLPSAPCIRIDLAVALALPLALPLALALAAVRRSTGPLCPNPSRPRRRVVTGLPTSDWWTKLSAAGTLSSSSSSAAMPCRQGIGSVELYYCMFSNARYRQKATSVEEMGVTPAPQRRRGTTRTQRYDRTTQVQKSDQSNSINDVLLKMEIFRTFGEKKGIF